MSKKNKKKDKIEKNSSNFSEGGFDRSILSNYSQWREEYSEKEIPKEEVLEEVISEEIEKEVSKEVNKVDDLDFKSNLINSEIEAHTFSTDKENKEINSEKKVESVDIFPIDGHNDDESIRNKMTKLIKKRQLSCYTFYGIYNENSIISTIIRNLCVIVFSLTNTRKYVEKIDKLAMSRKVENSEFADYVICKDMKKPVMKKEWFDKTMNHEFCGKMYKVPVEYDKILRTDYGDYMQLPPLDKQVTHHSFKVWKK